MKQQVCQSAYGTYIRGVTTVAARYIGHPAVAIPASEMVKTMMEEAAPTVNYLVQLEAGSKKESNIKEEKKPRIDKHTSGRFEYLKGCTNGWYTGFTKAIRGEQVIDEKYTLENLFSGNLTVEDMPDLPEYMTMVGAVIGAKYKGLWNSAKGTYDGVVTLVTDPEKVLEVASDAILDFMEDPWENTKELAGNIRDSVVDAVWRSTPQEISEDAGEILGDVLTAVSTGGGGKAAASGAKIAGKKLLALGKTGVREFVEGLEDLGKIGAKNAVYVGATTGIENAAKNSFINRLMMMASEAGDEAKKLTGVVEGATSKADDIATIAGKTGSVTNTVTSTTGELIENAVIGTPIVEGTKNITKEIVEGTTEKTTLRTTEKTTLQMLEEATDNIATGSKVDDIVEAEMKASSKVDDVAEVGAKASSKVDDVAGTGAKASSKVDDIAETGAKASSKADDVVETGAKASSKVDDIAGTGAKAGSKADDVAEAGAKISSKADDTAKAAGQTTTRTVVREKSDVNGSGSVNINGKRPNHNMDDIKTPETQVKGFISDADRMKLNGWKYRPSDELYLKYKEVYDNPIYYDQKTGDIHWPKDDGFLDGTKEVKKIPKGTTFKRYGEPSGEFLGNTKDSFESRALAPHSEGAKEYYYRLTEDFEMTTGKAAPYFGSEGGAEQFVKYKLDETGKYTIQELLDMGILEDITNLYISNK